MKKKIINLITYLFTLGLGIFFIWLSLKDLQPADIEEIKLAVRQANYNLLIPIIIMGLVSHWSRAVRWRCLMEPLGYTPSIKNTFFAVMISIALFRSTSAGSSPFGMEINCSPHFT